MANKYGLPLATPSKQTILPALTEAGVVMGFYPIVETTFTGTETTFATSDGVELPLKTVTVDQNDVLRQVVQYVAAVWPADVKHTYKEAVQEDAGWIHNPRTMKYEPWASADLFTKGEGYYRWYSMPTETWTLHFGTGMFIGGLMHNLAPEVPEPTAPLPPPGEDAAMEWAASLDYESVFGNCAFFEFNWMTVFKSKSVKEPLRIQVVSNPPPVPPATDSALKASIVGIPVGTANGVMYDNIRIMKLEALDKGDYVFNFKVFDDKGIYTPVTLTLTIK